MNKGFDEENVAFLTIHLRNWKIAYCSISPACPPVFPKKRPVECGVYVNVHHISLFTAEKVNLVVIFSYIFSGGIAQQNRRRIVHNEGIDVILISAGIIKISL